MKPPDAKRQVLDALGRAMGKFSMLRPGDRVAVAVSGGKDSLCLLHALSAYRQRAPFPYELRAVTIEQGKFKAPIHALEREIDRLGVPWMLREDPTTLGLVRGGVIHGCEVCSSHRRGWLCAPKKRACGVRSGSFCRASRPVTPASRGRSRRPSATSTRTRSSTRPSEKTAGHLTPKLRNI